MVQLIEKDAVLAEIDKKIYYFKDYEDRTVRNIACNILKGIKQSINTLEVKDVDLENIAAAEWDDYVRKIDGEPDNAYMLIKRNEYIELAKHFFELGLKAQKGE